MNIKVKLGDLCDFINGGAWSEREYVTSGIPVLKVSNFKPSGFILENVSRLSNNSLEKYKKNLLEKGDMVIATVGSHPNLVNSAAGRCCVVTDQVTGYLLNQNAVCIRTLDSEVLDQRYLTYLGKSFDFQHYIQSRGKGAANQMRIAISAIKEYEFDLPDIETQRRIADILSAYDNLIENNQKQIKLLEEAAIRFYKEWFVNMRFPGHETTKIVDCVPEGWMRCVLADVIDFNPTVPLEKNKKKRTVPMAALRTNSMVVDEELISTTTSKSGSKFSNNDTLLARITPCLENGKTAFVNFLEEAENAVGSTEFIVMRSKKLNPYIVYCIARSENFRSQAINSMAGADGRQRVKLDIIKAIEFLLPNGKIIESCQKYMKPLFNQIRVLNSQTLLLLNAHDKLLPKLMGGVIEV